MIQKIRYQARHKTEKGDGSSLTLLNIVMKNAFSHLLDFRGPNKMPCRDTIRAHAVWEVAGLDHIGHCTTVSCDDFDLVGNLEQLLAVLELENIESVRRLSDGILDLLLDLDLEPFQVEQ